MTKINQQKTVLVLLTITLICIELISYKLRGVVTIYDFIGVSIVLTIINIKTIS